MRDSLPILRQLFGFVAGEYFAKVMGVVIFLRIDGLITIFIQTSRIHGGSVNYFAFIMNPRYLDFFEAHPYLPIFENVVEV